MVIVGIVFLVGATKDTRTTDINTYNTAVTGELAARGLLTRRGEDGLRR